MIGSVKILLVTLVISLFFAGPVRACPGGGHGCTTEDGCITITDRYLNDKNIITSYSEITDLCGYPGVRVFENYGEEYLTPYSSHDGYAIVNKDGKFFDKVVTFTDDDLDKCCCKNGCYTDPGIWAFEFQVHNTSPYAWSDYHFELWDETFTNRYQNPALLIGWSSNIFQNSSLDDSILQFWAPDWQDPSETNTFLLYMDLNKFACGCDCTCGDNPCTCGCTCDVRAFGIRQVATTVPEPATMVLLGSGLLGAAAFRRLRKN
jgi:hypothetical protein